MNYASRFDITVNEIQPLRDKGMTIQKIADELGCSRDTVMSRLREAGIGVNRSEIMVANTKAQHAAIWPQIKDALDSGRGPSGLAREYHIEYLNLLSMMRDQGYPWDYTNLDERQAKRIKPRKAAKSGLGLDGFIQRSKAVHGDFYDYSEVEYKNTKTKVKIICPKHGPFYQAPEKHMVGNGCPHPECVQVRKETTNMARYGAAHPLQSKKIMEKMQKDNIEKYGVSNPMQLSEVKEKMVSSRMGIGISADTNIVSHHGPGFIGQDAFIQKAREIHGDYYDYSKSVYKTVREKLIIICPEHGEFLQSPEMHLKGYGCRKCAAKKREATMMERYGVAHAMQSDEILRKSRNVRKKRFGCQKPPTSGKRRISLEEFITRSREVHGDKYDYSKVDIQGTGTKVEIVCPIHGSFWQMPNKHMSGRGCTHKECIAQKKIDSNMAKYGVPNAMKFPEIVEKLKESNLTTYGVTNPMKLPEVRESLVKTNMEKYGVACTLELEEVKQQAWNTKIEEGTCNTSKAEETLYIMLCEKFGESDVQREYVSDKYPYHCDFYINSKDMYVELNGNFTHGGHWYCCGNQSDLDVVAIWQQRADEKNSDYYRNAIQVWTGNDVKKRQVARNGNLNYVVFWGNSLRDAALWFAMGCPDGLDWDHEYSWLPDRRILSSHDKAPVLTGTMQNLSQAAKHYQFRTFYHREIAMWDQNPVYRGLPLQLFLYHNRLKYIGKLPEQLTDLELARGFTISGILKGYTVFHAEMMDAAVQKYGIASVYDPCSGWGERALYCKSHGDLAYLGVDVNLDLFPGYDGMSLQYDLQDQKFLHGDSAKICLKGQYDAVVTCPPYGNTEIYSPDGAENLSESAFLQWWKNVVENSLSVDPRLFCFQINRKYRDSMLEIVEQCGFKLTEEIFPKRKNSSHFTRGKDGQDYKKEFETMLVCEKNPVAIP